jgi:hypothetical protein
MDHWDYGSDPNNPQVAAFAQRLFGNAFPGIGHNVAKALELYAFLQAHAQNDPAVVRERVRMNDAPMYSTEEMREILKTVRGQAGGAAAAPAIAIAPATATTVATPQPYDISRSKFWDKLIRRVTGPISRMVPSAFDGLAWFMFILYNLEQVEGFGPFLSAAFDSVTLSLPVLADMTQDVMGTLIALAPIPYASFIGDIVGYTISLLFILTAIMLNISRKHYGSAFKASLEAIPMFGDTLVDASQGIETGADRYEGYRKKMLASVDRISPHAKRYFDYWIPSVETRDGSELSEWPSESVKSNVRGFGARALGLDKLATGISAIPTLPVSVSALPAAIPAIPTIKSAASSLPLPVAAAATPNAVATKGGRRRTRRMQRMRRSRSRGKRHTKK